MRNRELSRIASAIEAQNVTALERNTGHEPTRKERLPFKARFCLWRAGGPKAEKRLRDCLAQFPIIFLVGPNGGGKTLALMVLTEATRQGIRWDCDHPDHAHTKKGITSGLRRMLSTVPILDGHGELHPLYDEYNDHAQLLEAEHCDIYWDEIVTVASSRESQRMDPRVLTKLVQLRKADIALYITAPNWARADKALREVCQVVVECRGYYPAPEGPDDDGSSLWRPKRVFNFRAFDSMEFDEWTAAKRDSIEALTGVWFYGPGSSAFSAYDTLGSVSVVASITPEDTCTVCDGRVTRHLCKCNERPTRRRPAANASLPLTPTGAPSESELSGAAT